MTQALAMKRILEDAGHEVVAAFMGENPERPIPQFFVDRFRGPIHTYRSPVFIMDPSQRGVRLRPMERFASGSGRHQTPLSVFWRAYARVEIP